MLTLFPMLQMTLALEAGAGLWLLVLFVGLYLAWNIGANDLANSMATSIGSQALTLRVAILLAIGFELAGALLFGLQVSRTVGFEVVNLSPASPATLLVGVLSAMLAAGIWLHVANYFGWPVSTTHSIIGGTVGFAAVTLGLSHVNWTAITWIVSLWIIAPIVAGIVSFYLCKAFARFIALRENVERMFLRLLIVSACLMAVAHGANDTANAAGPLTVAVSALQQLPIQDAGTIPIWVIVVAALGLAVGLAMWGWRVVETLGRRITQMTPSSAFAAQVAAALVVVAASLFALPVSTTHTLVGAVVGVGIAHQAQAVNRRTIREVVMAWILTIPMCMGLAILLYTVIALFLR